MTWKRLEGGVIDPELTEGISAAIADPVWLLARQWQVGEFRGEDASTPVLIDGTIIAAPVNEYWFGAGKDRPADRRSADGWPLEAVVEHEPIATGPAATRLGIESGAALLRRVRSIRGGADVVKALRQAYSFTGVIDGELDPVGAARLTLMARRGLDGRRVAAAVESVGGDPSLLPELADSASAGQIARAIGEWLRQEAALFCDVGKGESTAWSTPRLEYAFGVSAEVPGGSVELDAPEYPGGRLDWFHFDVGARPAEQKGAAARVAGLTRKTLESMPSPLTFAGMPAARWWEFEDRDVSFGDLAGGPDDLARSVIAAYALVAGDDWFVVPCSLPAGSLAEVTKLRVLDDFGTWTDVPSTAERDSKAGPRPWKYFELAGDPGPGRGQAPLLFLPPVVGSAEQSRPLETVEFRRDEMANIAWAIEHRVESAAGRSVDRQARASDAGSDVGSDPAEMVEDRWRYRLSTDVPDHWVPLVPVRIPGSRAQVVLRRGRIAAEGDGHPAKGTILEPDRPFVMHEEEIPVGGIRVDRRYQLARGANGRVYVWVGRRKVPSGGPMRRTPLRFDTLTGWSQQH